MRPFLMRTGAATVAAAGIVLVAVPASAAPKPNPHRISVAASPIRILVPYSPHAQTRYFRVENVGPNPATLTMHIHRLVQTRAGEMSLAPAIPAYGAGWLKILPLTMTLKPHQTRRVQVIIKVPRKAAGDRYLAIAMTLPTSHMVKGKANVRFSVGVAVQLIIKTPGKPRHDVAFTGLTAPGFSFGGKIPLTVSMVNHGNVYALNNHVIASADGTPVRFPGILALAGATRTVSATWTASPAFCWCRVSLDGQTTHVLIISPLILIAAGAILAGLLIFFLTRWRYKRKPAAAPTDSPDSGLRILRKE